VVTNFKHDNALVNSNIKLNGSNIKNNIKRTVNIAENFSPNNGVVVLTDQTSSALLLGKWVIVEYRNRAVQTETNIFVYDSKNNVASTGRAFLAVNFCTIAEYRLSMIKIVAIIMRNNGTNKSSHAFA